MNPPRVPLDLWRILLRQATEIHARRLWRDVSPAALLGVEVQGRQSSWVRIHGGDGEGARIEIFRGLEGLRGFLELLSSGTSADSTRGLEVPRLEIAYLEREDLDETDLELRERCALVPAVDGAWPRIRSYRPGFLPWHFETEECEAAIVALDRLLVQALEGTPAQAPRSSEEFVVHVLVQPEPPQWQVERRRVELPERGLLIGDLDRATAAKLRELPGSGSALDLDLLLLPAAVREGPRPFMPYLLLGVDADSGRVVVNELLRVTSSVEELLARVPAVLAQNLLRSGRRPARLRSDDARLCAALHPFGSLAAIPVEPHESLPELERARDSFLKALRGE